MKKPQLYSLFLVFFSSYLLFSCGNKEAKIYALNYPDMEWHWTAIQTQLAQIQASDPICCYEEALLNFKAKDIIEETFKKKYDSTHIEKHKIELPAYKTNIYANYIDIQRSYYCQGGFLLKTIAFEDKHYLWTNIDAGDRIFWTNSDVAAKDTAQILFDYKCLSGNIGLPLQTIMSRDTDFNKQFDLALGDIFNKQFYLEARNKKGYIFELRKTGQINELNRFLHDNTAFHKIENKHKIDSFLMLLYKADDKNMYKKLPFTDFSKKGVDSMKLQIKGFDYFNQVVYYFDSIDSLNIIGEYLSQNSPTFLYYKYKGNYELRWQNYFLAYHLTYANDGCPIITKVDIIIPERMYLYVCYPMGFCNDVGPSAYYLVGGTKMVEPKEAYENYRPSK